MNTPYTPIKKIQKEEFALHSPFSNINSISQGIVQGEINILVPFYRPPRYTLPMNFTTYYVLGDDKAFEDLSKQFQNNLRLPEKEDIKDLIRSVLRKRFLTRPLYNK